MFVFLERWLVAYVTSNMHVISNSLLLFLLYIFVQFQEKESSSVSKNKGHESLHTYLTHDKSLLRCTEFGTREHINCTYQFY